MLLRLAGRKYRLRRASVQDGGAHNSADARSVPHLTSVTWEVISDDVSDVAGYSKTLCEGVVGATT